MVRNYVPQKLKPKERELSEDSAFVWNRSWHYDIERGEAVSGDDQQFVAEIVDVANFAAAVKREIGKGGFEQRCGCQHGNCLD